MVPKAEEKLKEIGKLESEIIQLENSEIQSNQKKHHVNFYIFLKFKKKLTESCLGHFRNYASKGSSLYILFKLIL